MPSNKNVMTGTPKAGVGGYLFRAPLGTALPADEKTALAAAYIDQGYVSEDGVEKAISKTYKTISDMGGTEVLKTRTEIGVKLTLALLETLNANTAKTVYGDAAVTVTAATVSAGTKIALAFKGDEVPNSVWVLETALGGKIARYVFPVAQQATEDQTITLNSANASVLPVELTLYPDASGVYFYRYTDDGVFSA